MLSRISWIDLKKWKTGKRNSEDHTEQDVQQQGRGDGNRRDAHPPFLVEKDHDSRNQGRRGQEITGFLQYPRVGESDENKDTESLPRNSPFFILTMGGDLSLAKGLEE